MNPLTELVGQTDIYLLDLIMKEHVRGGMKILDAGCGGGRNLWYFMKQGFDVCGTDASETAIKKAIDLKNELNLDLPDSRFQVSAVELMPFENNAFDLVISSAVLHFAKDENHWNRMIDEMWRVLKPGGIFFSRLATSIGIENRIQHLHDRHYLLPDGNKRFLTTETMILRKTHSYGASFVEPVKSTIVENSRTMTTWVIRKP
jgi:ubiquinone/menaquinone biosynthesis C-methylase UbiE